jgi:cyclase
MKKGFQYSTLLFFCGNLLCSIQSFSQDDLSKITVRSTLAGGTVHMLDCENGFGGGNVAASIGPDGILLVDDMYKLVTPRLVLALKKNK